jgi:hypothetical protein
VDAGSVAASYLKDALTQGRAIEVLNLDTSQPSFSAAFQTARNAGADYFLLLQAGENERDLTLSGSLYVAHSGSTAQTFTLYRSGADRLRNAVRGIASQLTAALPLRAGLLQRKTSQGLIDKGKADGVTVGQVFNVIKKGRQEVLSEGVGLAYTADDIVGVFTVSTVDEAISAGTLVRNGFFDRIEAGDELVIQPAAPDTVATDATAAPAATTTPATATTPTPPSGTTPTPAATVNPELRDLLKMLR